MAGRASRVETTEDKHARRQDTSSDVTSGSGAREKDRTWRQHEDSDSSKENENNLLLGSIISQFAQLFPAGQELEPYMQNEDHKRRLRQGYMYTPLISQASANPVHREQAGHWFGHMQAERGMSEDAQLFVAAVTGQSANETWTHPPEEAGQSSAGPTEQDPPSDPLGSNAISSAFSTIYDANTHEPNLAAEYDVYMKPQNAGRPVRTFSLGKRQASEGLEDLGDGAVGQVKRSYDNFLSMHAVKEGKEDDTENQDVNVGPPGEYTEAGALEMPRKRNSFLAMIKMDDATEDDTENQEVYSWSEKQLEEADWTREPSTPDKVLHALQPKVHKPDENTDKSKNDDYF